MDEQIRQILNYTKQTWGAIALMKEMNRAQRQDTAGIKAQLHILQQRMFNKSSYYQQLFSTPLKIQTTKGNSKTMKDITDNTHMNNIHRLVLQKNVELMVKDLNLKQSSILDKLCTDCMLSAGECDEILSDDCNTSRNRKFICKLSGRSEDLFMKFLQHLKPEFLHVHEQLNASYEQIVKCPITPTCLICVIKRDVVITDVIDKLYQCNLINSEIYNIVCFNPKISAGSPQRDLWECVLQYIDSTDDRKNNISKLQEILYQKYEHLAAKLGTWCKDSLRCHCISNMSTNSNDSHSSSNNSERSTTSTRPLYTKLTNINGRMSLEESSIDSSEISSNPAQSTDLPVFDWLLNMPDDQEYPQEYLTDENQNQKHYKHPSETRTTLKSIGQEILKPGVQQANATSELEQIPSIQKVENMTGDLSVTEQIENVTPGKNINVKSKRKKNKRNKNRKYALSDQTSNKNADSNPPHTENSQNVRVNISDLILNNTTYLPDSSNLENVTPVEQSHAVTDVLLNSQQNKVDRDQDTTNINDINSDMLHTDKLQEKADKKNNNPKYVTDVEIITPSNSVQTESTTTKMSKKQKRQEKRLQRRRNGCSVEF